MYSIEFTTSAAREFRSLEPQLKRRIAQAIDPLAHNPRPRGTRKLKGHEHLYRLRIGHYRVVYEVRDDVRVVKITQIRHRRDAYR